MVQKKAKSKTRKKPVKTAAAGVLTKNHTPKRRKKNGTTKRG